MTRRTTLAWAAQRVPITVLLLAITAAAMAGGTTPCVGAAPAAGGTRKLMGNSSTSQAPPPTAQLPNVTDPKLLEALGASARQCLAGKRVLLVGNSVTRNWLFVLNDLLQGAGVNFNLSSDHETMRKTQKGFCAHAEAQANNSHDNAASFCRLRPGNGSVTLDLLWQKLIFNPVLSNALSMNPAHDIIIANLGGNDLYDAPERKWWMQHLINESEKLADAFAALPNTTYVYWRTTTRLCAENEQLWARPDWRHADNDNFPMINRCLAASNAHIVDALARRAPNVQIFDAYEHTMPCRNFVDHIHHPVAAIDHVLLFMSRYCGLSFGRLALAAFPHLEAYLDSTSGVKPQRCQAQQAVLRKKGAREWADGFDWVDGVMFASGNPVYEVAC